MSFLILSMLARTRGSWALKHLCFGIKINCPGYRRKRVRYIFQVMPVAWNGLSTTRDTSTITVHAFGSSPALLPLTTSHQPTLAALIYFLTFGPLELPTNDLCVLDLVWRLSTWAWMVAECIALQLMNGAILMRRCILTGLLTTIS